MIHPEVYDIVGVAHDEALPSYTFHGCYPLVYTAVSWGDTLDVCGACASALAQGEDDTVRYVGVLWEGAPVVCDACGKEIESTYGVPEEEVESCAK